MDMMLLTEVAKVLGVERCTLDRWNAQGKGPRRHKIGPAVVYDREEVREFVREKIKPMQDLLQAI